MRSRNGTDREIEVGEGTGKGKGKKEGADEVTQGNQVR